MAQDVRSSHVQGEARRWQARILHRSEQRRIAIAGNVIVTFEDVEPDFDFLDEMLVIVKNAGREYPSGIALMFNISPTCKPPPEEVRARIKRDRAHFGQHVRAAAHVLHGSGFLVAANRGVLSLLLLASRPPFPMKVFAEGEAASKWLLAELGDAALPAMTSLELTRTIDQASREH